MYRFPTGGNGSKIPFDMEYKYFFKKYLTNHDYECRI